MIPFPCNSCIHFSGMGFIPYCKKKVIAQVNNKPVYEWCSIMRSFDGECGVDSKLYEKTDNVIRIRPTIVYSGKNHENISKSNNTDANDNSVKLDKINKYDKNNGNSAQRKRGRLCKTIKAAQTNQITESIPMEHVEQVLARTS